MFFGSCFSTLLSDELSQMLLAKNDKGRSKLLELIVKSEGTAEGQVACAALVDKLCAGNAT